MGYSSLASQALSAPPYLVAFIVVLVTTYLSDRNRSRSPYIITHALLSSLAYLTIAATGYFHAYLPPSVHITVRYLCLYPAASGFFSAISLNLAWTMDNRVASESKGASVAMLNIIGQCGPLLGTRLYPDTDGPWYIRGMAVCSVFMVVVAVLAIVLRVMLQRENRRSAVQTGQGVNNDMEMEMEEREVLMGGGNNNDNNHVRHVEGQGFVYII